MNSIGENCNELKKQYDACFNNWFAEKFLKGDLEDNSCLPMFRVYQTCVKKAMKEQNIDLKDITEKDYLADELPPKSQNTDSAQKQPSNDRPKVSSS